MNARREQAWAVLSAMRAAGVAPNTRSYNALLAACDRGQQPERALEVLCRMQRAAAEGAPCLPSRLCHAGSGCANPALAVLRRMQRAVGGGQPPLFS